jgi:hypothetical protein
MINKFFPEKFHHVSDKKIGNCFGEVCFFSVNSTNFANFGKNIFQFLNITKLKRKTHSGD